MVEMFIIQQMSLIQPMLRVQAKKKLVTRRFGAKIMPPRMPHEMSECLGTQP